MIKISSLRHDYAQIFPISQVCWWAIFPLLSLYSLSRRTSYHKISWSLEAAIFGYLLFRWLCNLTGTSAAPLPRCLLNCRAIPSLWHRISRLRYLTSFCGKTSVRSVKALVVNCQIIFCILSASFWIKHSNSAAIITGLLGKATPTIFLHR